jgi:hypothetical protein
MLNHPLQWFDWAAAAGMAGPCLGGGRVCRNIETETAVKRKTLSGPELPICTYSFGCCRPLPQKWGRLGKVMGLRAWGVRWRNAGDGAKGASGFVPIF